MWWRATQSKGDRVARCALANIAFAAVLLVFSLMGSAAEACPGSKQTAGSVAAAHEIERVSSVPIAIVSAAFNQTSAKPYQSGSCCGAGCHAHGAACGNACCPSGFAANGLLVPGLFSPADSIRLSPLDQAKAVSARPPPDLRPPRTLA